MFQSILYSKYIVYFMLYREVDAGAALKFASLGKMYKLNLNLAVIHGLLNNFRHLTFQT